MDVDLFPDYPINLDQNLNSGSIATSLGLLYMGLWNSIFFNRSARGMCRKKPHVVFMLADDLGWDDVSLHGSKQIPTPNVDVLAKDGILLQHYYTQPICTPSRGSLMTGKYPIRLGLQHDVIWADTPWGLPVKEKILPQYLKDLGYSTHIVGKWHLGYYNVEHTPLKRGFDSFFGYYNGLDDYFTHEVHQAPNFTGLDLHDNFENVWSYNGTYGADLFTDKAKKIIQEHDPSKPLFLYFAQQSPHSGNFNNPLQAPDKYVDPMVGIEDNKTRIFAGMVSSMDHSLGEIFDALDKSGMLEDTLFIFSSDNGGAVRETMDGTCGSNFPLKGCKYTLWEGGVRGTAFIWSHALRKSSRIYNGLMHITDWLPTILSAVGGSEALKMLPNEIDGVDHWPSLTEESLSPRQEILLNIDTVEKAEALRRGKYKVVKGTNMGGHLDKWYDGEGRVFNASYSLETPKQKKIYKKNYGRFLKRSKAAHILWTKYNKHPFISSCYYDSACKELQVRCGMPPPPAGSWTSCNATEEACLFDIEDDPCEFHNIAEELPEKTAELLEAIDNYKPFAIPSGEKPPDLNADPKRHGNAWVPWR